MNIQAISRLLAPLERRIKLLATRAVVRLVSSGEFMQTVQVEALAGELLDGVEHWEPYGFTSNPLAGAEALLLAIAGRRGHAVAVNVADRRYRLRNLRPGEAAIYDDQGQVIALLRDKTIHIYGCDLVKVEASIKIRFETPLLEVTGEIRDRCDSDGRSMEQMRTTYDSHAHPGDSGGTTGTPDHLMG